MSKYRKAVNPRLPRVKLTCDGCGIEVERLPAEVRPTTYCNRSCYMKNGVGRMRMGSRPRTKSTETWVCPDGVTRGVVTDAQGYKHVYWPEHPNANAGFRVGVHVVVMADYLGRPLEPGETPHHIFGDKSDNRIEHLELWTKAQPAGQRVSDKVRYARMLLAAYGEPDERERYAEYRDSRMVEG